MLALLGGALIAIGVTNGSTQGILISWVRCAQLGLCSSAIGAVAGYLTSSHSYQKFMPVVGGSLSIVFASATTVIVILLLVWGTAIHRLIAAIAVAVVVAVVALFRICSSKK